MFNKTLKNCFNIAYHIETETKDPIKSPKKLEEPVNKATINFFNLILFMSFER
jgi:hypothetical protein